MAAKIRKKQIKYRLGRKNARHKKRCTTMRWCIFLKLLANSGKPYRYASAFSVGITET